MLQFIDFLSFSNMPSHENSIAAQVSYRSSTLQFHIAVSHRSTSNFEAQSSHTRTFWVENFNGTNLSQRHIATSLNVELIELSSRFPSLRSFLRVVCSLWISKTLESKLFFILKHRLFSEPCSSLFTVIRLQMKTSLLAVPIVLKL